MKYLQSILAVVTLMAFVFGGYFYVDKTYAKSYSVQQIEQRLDIKILTDASRGMQRDIYIIEDRYEGLEMPFDKKKRLRELKDTKSEVDRELNITIQELKRKK